MDHPLDSVMGMMALQEPFEKTDEQLRAAGERYIRVFGPIMELPEDFSKRLRSLMVSYRSVGMRS